MMLKAILDHLKGHPAEYLLLLIVVFGFGWQASAVADFWVDGKIKKVVAEEAGPLKLQVQNVQKDLDALKEGLSDLRARSLKREIIEIRTLLCYSPGDTRLIRNYEDAQELYQDLTSSPDDAPKPLACSPVRMMRGNPHALTRSRSNALISFSRPSTERLISW